MLRREEGRNLHSLFPKVEVYKRLQNELQPAKFRMDMISIHILPLYIDKSGVRCKPSL